MSDFSDELAAATTTASYIERNPEQKARVYMIDLLERADRHTISLPDYVADHFKKCFENGELTIKEAKDVIDILGEYSKNKGYSWKHTIDEHVYSSDTEKSKFFIKITNYDEMVPLYTAIRSENGKETELCRSHEYTDCEKKIGEHFYNAASFDMSEKEKPQIVTDLIRLANKHDYDNFIINNTIDYIMRYDLRNYNNEPLKESDLRNIIDDRRLADCFKNVFDDDNAFSYSVEDFYSMSIKSLQTYMNDELKYDESILYEEYEDLRDHAYEKIRIMRPYIELADNHREIELAAATTPVNYIELSPEQKSTQMIVLLEHADRCTVSLPEYVVDHFKKCFENGELTIREANDVIDKLAEYSNNKGYSWDQDTFNEEWKEQSYSSETEQCKAYIRVSGDGVYTASYSDNGKDTMLCKSEKYEDCKKIIGEHFYNAALSDLSKNGNEPQIVKDLVTLANKHKVFENVIDSSKQLGLTLPKNQMEVIRESLVDGTMSVKEHLSNLEKVAEKLTVKSLQWVLPDSHAPNQLSDYLVDKDSKVQAYIQKLTNSKTSETFYTANCLSTDKVRNYEIFITVATSSSVDLLKSNINAYITGTVLKEVAQEASKDLVKATPDKSPSKECSLSL